MGSQQFSGDLARKMMVGMLIWSGYRGRGWGSMREMFVLSWEKMKKRKKTIEASELAKEWRDKWMSGGERG